jgi:DNA anti-recombination protein RmuC
VTDLGSAIVGLAVGLAAGAVLMAARYGGHRSREHLGASRLEARLEVQASDLRRLADSVGVRDALAERLHEEVAGARRALHHLSISERQRQERDREAWTVVRRLSTVLAGGPSQGRAGENVLRQHLTQLPPGILITDFKVNGKVVEFGLLLPDGRRLPIDSKWSALSELEALEAAEDPGDLDARAREVERVVAHRAREVAQYLDPALTAPVAVAAVPDAAYAVLKRAHADAFTKGVVIVPYSTALPVLLFLYSLVARFGDTGDVQAVLAEVGSLLDAMEGILENKIARAATMIGNGADEFRSQLGKARGSVSRARAAGGAQPSRAVGVTADVLHALP